MWRRLLTALALAIFAAGLATSALPQAASFVPLLTVDRERVMVESARARALADAERAARASLGAELEALRQTLETEEAEIAALRDAGDRAIFETRVREFDQRVREARRDSQAKGEALQARFAAARRDLAAALEPVLLQLLQETGAALIFDSRSVLASRPGADVTEEAIRRFDAAAAESSSPPTVQE